MMAAHWEHWVDQPIPILGNRTPMEAVKDPDGREIVESLVIQAERIDRSPNLPWDEDVFRRLRERLGLAGSRSQSGGPLYKQLGMATGGTVDPAAQARGRQADCGDA
jgi:hypothetical protein